MAWDWRTRSLGLVCQHEGWLPAAPSGALVLGRGSECSLRLRDATLSRHHARFTEDAQGWWLEDLRSTSGTRLGAGNAARQVVRERISSGTVFSAGTRVFTFRDEPGPARSEELEAALRARPDDDGLLLTYADFLQEQGDPRGRWMVEGGREVISVWQACAFSGLAFTRRRGLVDRVTWRTNSVAGPSKGALSWLLSEWEGSFVRDLEVQTPLPMPEPWRLVDDLPLPPTLERLSLPPSATPLPAALEKRWREHCPRLVLARG